MSWSKLSSGVGSTVNAIALSGNVYVGGNFSGYVSSWDGSSWTNIGSSGTTKPNNYCYSIAVDSIGNVYAGGTGSGSGYIYKWNGTVWSMLGPSAPNQTVYTIAYNYSNGLLYAGGDFSQIGGVNARNIAKWNGTTWSAIDATNNANNIVSAIAIDSGGNIYAGGYFTQIGGNLINYIAKWNGSAWSALGTGVTGGSVNAIAIDSNNNVYAGGNFTGAGGVTGTSRIAKWNPSTNTWSALGTGVSGGNPTVTSIAVNSSGIVYVILVYNIWQNGMECNGQCLGRPIQMSTQFR
jgi:trimeric autotransporter adhesin